MKITIELDQYFEERLKEMVSAALQAKFDELVQVIVSEAQEVKNAIDDLKAIIEDGTATDEDLIARLDNLKLGVQGIYQPVADAVGSLGDPLPNAPVEPVEAPVEDSEPVASDVVQDSPKAPEVPIKTSDLGQ